MKQIETRKEQRKTMQKKHNPVSKEGLYTLHVKKKCFQPELNNETLHCKNVLLFCD